MSPRLGALIIGITIVACGPAPRRGGDYNPSDGGNNGADACVQACSADLHSITDCDGNVITTCPDGQGCSNGGCMPACDAAAADNSTIGCDYYAVDPDIIPEGAGGCFSAYVANTWGSPISISVDLGGTPLTVTDFARVPTGQGQGLAYAPLTGGMLQPNEVAILFLAQYGPGLPTAGIACPSGITPAITATDAAVHGTGLGQAFHITTSAPIVAYDIYPYGGGDSAATSATLLIPTSGWDVNYLAVDAYRQSAAVTGAQPFIEIVGQAPTTHVTIRPTAAIVGGPGVAAAAQGFNMTYTLTAGQVLQFTQDAELNGSPITADQPVGVWGGASCLSIDINAQACDSAHQEIPPVHALGFRYAGVRYRNRYENQEETVPWRILGAVDGTTLTYLPSTPAGAPTTLSSGQIVEFNAPGPFFVQSQDSGHPFYMSAHMTGYSMLTTSFGDRRGDPEFVNVVPPEQYLSSYTFFTDPTYPETNLVLTRERHDGSFADVTIDCSGTVGGWMPIDANDTVEYARVDLVTGNFQSANGCDNGRHVATSARPFGLVVWGWGSAASGGFFTQAVSYAYPAGASIRPINPVVIE